MALPAAERAALDLASEPRFFIPVCLYPHTRYRTRQGLLDLVGKFDLSAFDHLIVVADRLLALDRIVTGRFWNETAVFDKARRESKDVFRLIRKVADSQGMRARCRLAYWDDIAASPDFGAFSARLLAACRAEAAFMAQVERFVEARILRFGQGVDPERERRAEFDYILGEISMSVYCTEVLLYWNEIWERPLEPGTLDPLGLLYQGFPQVVRAACGHDRTRRRLSFLFEEARPQSKPATRASGR